MSNQRSLSTFLPKNVLIASLAILILYFVIQADLRLPFEFKIFSGLILFCLLMMFYPAAILLEDDEKPRLEEVNRYN